MNWKRGQRPDYLTMPLIERIWNKIRIDKHGCHIWLGALSVKRGKNIRRPVIQLGGRGTPVVPVMRVQLSLHDGVPLDERADLQACHKINCRAGRICVNPEHGYWGTREDNDRDRRQARDFGRFV